MFSKWIIFIFLFSFAENSPVATSQEQHDITNELNEIILNIIRSFEWNTVYIHVRNNTDDTFTSTVFSPDVRFQNGIHFRNFTMTFKTSPTLKIQLVLYDNITATCEMASVSLKGYLNNTDHYIATEPIPLNFTLQLPTLQSKDDGKKPVIVNYHNFDQYEIKLFTNSYYHPNEENQIKRDFKTQLKKILNEKINQDWKVSLIFLGYTFLRGLGQKSVISTNHADFEKNEENHYYFISTIPNDDYTLSDVTIKGLWNFRSILLDFANPVAFPEVQMSNLTGTMRQKWHLRPEKPFELSFKINTISIAADQRASTVNVKAEGYSVKIIKTNMILNDPRDIIERIESAIAAVLSAHCCS